MKKDKDVKPDKTNPVLPKNVVMKKGCEFTLVWSGMLKDFKKDKPESIEFNLLKEIMKENPEINDGFYRYRRDTKAIEWHRSRLTQMNDYNALLFKAEFGVFKLVIIDNEAKLDLSSSSSIMEFSHWTNRNNRYGLDILLVAGPNTVVRVSDFEGVSSLNRGLYELELVRNTHVLSGTENGYTPQLNIRADSLMDTLVDETSELRSGKGVCGCLLLNNSTLFVSEEEIPSTQLYRSSVAGVCLQNSSVWVANSLIGSGRFENCCISVDALSLKNTIEGNKRNFLKDINLILPKGFGLALGELCALAKLGCMNNRNLIMARVNDLRVPDRYDPKYMLLYESFDEVGYEEDDDEIRYVLFNDTTGLRDSIREYLFPGEDPLTAVEHAVVDMVWNFAERRLFIIKELTAANRLIS